MQIALAFLAAAGGIPLLAGFLYDALRVRFRQLPKIPQRFEVAFGVAGFLALIFGTMLAVAVLAEAAREFPLLMTG